MLREHPAPLTPPAPFAGQVPATRQWRRLLFRIDGVFDSHRGKLNYQFSQALSFLSEQLQFVRLGMRLGTFRSTVRPLVRWFGVRHRGPLHESLGTNLSSN